MTTQEIVGCEDGRGRGRGRERERERETANVKPYVSGDEDEAQGEDEGELAVICQARGPARRLLLLAHASLGTRCLRVECTSTGCSLDSSDSVTPHTSKSFRKTVSFYLGQ